MTNLSITVSIPPQLEDQPDGDQVRLSMPVGVARSLAHYLEAEGSIEPELADQLREALQTGVRRIDAARAIGGSHAR